MNKGIIAALSFVSGAVSAGTGVYFYMKKWSDKRLSEEIEAFKASYKTVPRYPHVDDIPDTIVAKEEEPSEDTKRETRTKSSISDGPVEAEKIAYHKLASNYTKSEADLALEEAENEENGPSEEDATLSDGDICIISLEQYEDDDEYEQVELDWFLDGDTLVDEFADVVSDESRAALFGDILDTVKSEIPRDTNGHLIHIRNNKSKSDYRITVIWDSFQ